MPKETIHAKGLEIGIYTEDFENEFISLTDIARYQNIEDPRFVVRNWMRNRDVVELLGLWEMLHNPNFNRAAFGTFKNQAGKHAFVISQEKNQSERLVLLREAAVRQMQSLISVNQNRINGATS